MAKLATSVFIFLFFIASSGGAENGISNCSKNDIMIAQGEGRRQFNGIPTYIVQITNQCRTGCAIADIHLRCGPFSSATLINPTVFKRIANNDCLVNNGVSIPAGETVSFQYSTTFKFPLSISSFKCL